MPSRPAKPADLPRIMPYLTVRDVAAAMEFCQRAFGFEPRPEAIIQKPDGSLMHGESRFHEGVVMFGPQTDTGDESQAPQAGAVTASVSLYIYCDDVDALYVRATAAGALADSQPQEMFWGDRICTFTDPDGHRWTFATNVSDFDPSKIPMNTSQ